jgi:DNA-binding MarR family transcriptional regulator
MVSSEIFPNGIIPNGRNGTTVRAVTLRASDPVVDLWQRLLRFERVAAMHLDAQLERERALSLEDYDVLYQLHAAGEPMRMSDLAAATLIARSSCTRVVDRLVERGWVERRAHAADRRSVVVALTPTGRQCLRRAAVTHLRGIDAVFASRLDAADLADLDRIVTRLATDRTAA